MRIENLHEGQVIKDYKELCELLEIEPKATGNTNGRKSHHKEFNRYFNFEKQGRKYIIKSIYDTPLAKQDKRGGNNSIFSDDIELLILNMLSNSKEETVTIARGQLYKALSMCNENYLLCRSNMSKLSEIIELPKSSIYEFYDNNSTKLRDTVERNLKRLRNKSLIMWKVTTTVVTTEIEFEYNELGDPIYDKRSRNIKYKVNTIHKIASKSEEKIILKYEKQVMEEMGFETLQDIFLRGKWKIFKNGVEKKLRDNGTNIDYYYDTYTITFNNEDVKKHLIKLSSRDISNIKQNINNNMIESIKKSTIKRNQKASRDIKLNDTNYSTYKLNKLIRQEDIEYVHRQDKLTTTLIDKNAKSLKNDILNYELDYRKLSKINETHDEQMWNKDIPF